MKNFPFEFINGKEAVHESFGISEERFKELNYQMELIIHEDSRPVREGDTEPLPDSVLGRFCELADDVQEFALVLYLAGIRANLNVNNGKLIGSGY